MGHVVQQRAQQRSLISATFMLCLLGQHAHLAAASSGDEGLPFRRCLGHCTSTGCTPGSAGSLSQAQPRCSPLCAASGDGGGRVSLALRLWQWDCSSDCSYACMWELEERKHSGPSGRSEAEAAAGGVTEKYYGKWPFVRAWGMQEPASVLFSLLNLAANVAALGAFLRLQSTRRLRPLTTAHASSADRAEGASHGGAKQQQKGGAGANGGRGGNGGRGQAYPYAWLWLIQFALSINAWLWSSIFHARDTRVTERLDYFSAGALVAFNLFASGVRVSGSTLSGSNAALGANAAGSRRRIVVQWAAAGGLAAYYVRHMLRMHYVLFDYGWHVLLCIGAGAVQSLLWLGWAAAQLGLPGKLMGSWGPSKPRRSSSGSSRDGGRSGSSGHHPGARLLAVFVLVINACMALEVLDFPPFWGVLDAHSLWHLTTAPLTALWYAFLAADLDYWYDGSSGNGTGSKCT
jgi:hypothetical protein